MQQHERIFKDFLAGRKMVYTQTRKLILEKVFALHEHFDAEQLYDDIRKVSRTVSRATVYRTIPLLVSAGLIQKSVRGGSRDTYEHIYGHPRHAHWVCSNCGAVQETGLQDLAKLLENKAKAQNFHISKVSLEIRGLCWKCK